jgi:energy-coupling factor transport system ATP-binding protein
MENSVLSLKNVSYCYPGTKKYSLEEINVEIKAGEFVGIVGANGSGRSTFCYCLNGLIPQSIGGKLKGEVIIRGIDSTQSTTAKIAQWVGLVFSDPEAQLTQLSVADEIAFGPANLGVPLDEIFRLIKEILRMIQLEGLEERNTHSLSGGQQQRLAIGSVLAMKPEILVLDEPTSNLDPQGVEEVFSIVTRLNRENKTTLVMVEQQVNLLAQFASRILVMDQGKIIADGSPEEVFSQIDTVSAVGVQVPQVTQLCHAVSPQAGIRLNSHTSPVTVEQGCKFLRSYLERRDTAGRA